MLYNDTSTVNLPVYINKGNLEKKINQIIGQDLFLDEGGLSAGLKITAKRRDYIKLDLHENVLVYKVPLKLEIAQNIGFTTLNADGELDLILHSNYYVNKDWNLTTTTHIESHRWIAKPKLNFGGIGSIPIQSLADFAIQRVSHLIGRTIDHQVQQNLDLNKIVGSAWKSLQQEVKLSKEYGAYLVPNPIDISLAPLSLSGDMLKTQIVALVHPQVLIGSKPYISINDKLPQFRFEELTNEETTLTIGSVIPYDRASELVKKSIIGQRFGTGGKQVEIVDIELYGQNDKLIVNTKTQGFYNGEIFVSGILVYNANKEQIKLMNLDFDFSTKNFLLKSMAWLLKGRFKNMIESTVNKQLSEYVKDIRIKINDQFEEYSPIDGLLLKGTLDQLNLEKMQLTPEGINIRVAMKGVVIIQIEDF